MQIDRLTADSTDGLIYGVCWNIWKSLDYF